MGFLASFPVFSIFRTVFLFVFLIFCVLGLHIWSHGVRKRRLAPSLMQMNMSGVIKKSESVIRFLHAAYQNKESCMPRSYWAALVQRVVEQPNTSTISIYKSTPKNKQIHCGYFGFDGFPNTRESKAKNSKRSSINTLPHSFIIGSALESA